MKQEKIKLKRLERLLMDVADDLRGKMDASEYKEWKAKLEKTFFDDLSIQKGIDESYRLFTTY